MAAAVEGNERAVIVRACQVLASSLEEAGGGPWSVGADFFATLGEIPPREQPALLVASLSRDLARSDTSLAQIETAWRQELEAVTSACAQPVFLCTVFRHIEVPPTLGTETSWTVRERIRRLNLMAARLSQATGVNVIDIDRSLAQIGARNLGTDWTLAGADAEQTAAYIVARTLLADCPDEIIPLETQTLAREAVARGLLSLQGRPTSIPLDSAAPASSRRHQVFISPTQPIDYFRRGLIGDFAAERFGVVQTVAIVARNLAKIGHRNAAGILRRLAMKRLRRLMARGTSAK